MGFQLLIFIVPLKFPIGRRNPLWNCITPTLLDAHCYLATLARSAQGHPWTYAIEGPRNRLAKRLRNRKQIIHIKLRLTWCAIMFYRRYQVKSNRRIALVTGASKGVGRGIAIGLAEAGWAVGINYFQDKVGAELTASRVRDTSGTAWVVQADVGYVEQVHRMFGEFMKSAGGLNLMVNNSGVQTWAPLLELAEKDWDRTIRTNLKGTFLCTQQAGRIMKEAGGGSIVNIGSGANKAPFPNLVDYCASKGGIETFTTAAAVELRPHGIRVNCVAPGTIEIERTQAESPNYEQSWSPLTPLRRVGQVKDVARAVRFFGSSESEFVTGQTLYVDGGLWSQVPWPYDK